MNLRSSRRLLYLMMGLATLVSSGCLAVAAGVAGGAAATCLYYNGKVCRIYNAAFEDAVAATQIALADLGMPVESVSRQSAACGLIESRTSDGDRVRIFLDTELSKFPAEGLLTRISVRVALFGDHSVSNRLLDQIGAHLVPSPTAAAPVPPPTPPLEPPQPVPTTGLPPQPIPTTAIPPQTAPPPLAN